MAYEIPGFKVTREAAADLSTKQFHFVKLDSNGRVAAIAAATDRPFGILQNKPSALGIAAEIMVTGWSQIYCSANMAKGDMVGTSATGRAVAIVAGTDTTKYNLGTMVDDGDADGEVGVIQFSCLAPNRAA